MSGGHSVVGRIGLWTLEIKDEFDWGNCSIRVH